MSEVNAVKKEMQRVRTMNKTLKELMIKNVVRYDFGIKGRLFDLMLHSEYNLLETLKVLYYPQLKSLENLVNDAYEISETFGKLIQEFGINFRMLEKGDKYCASRFVNEDEVAVDTEEWEQSHIRVRDYKAFLCNEDEEYEEAIIEMIETFKENMIKEMWRLLEKEQVDYPCLYIRYIDILPHAVTIDDLDTIDQGYMESKRGQLIWPIDESLSQFVEKHRGQLVGRLQIVDNIPEDLNVFAIIN
jgi:hypothetical protein